MMNKILVIGNSGSGKSTFSKKLSKSLELELIHLDNLFWRPNWVKTEKEEFDDLLKKELEKSKWIMDGNFNRTLDRRIEKADTIIFFDLPTYRCLFNDLKRFIKGKFLNYKRTDITEGCNERININHIKWIINYRKNYRNDYLEKFKKQDNKSVIIIKNYKKAEDLLENIRIQNS